MRQAVDEPKGCTVCGAAMGFAHVVGCSIAQNSENRKLEAVNHPQHYGGKDNLYEVIKVMEAWLTREEFIGAMKFNIHKYLARALKKDTADQNYAKAGWYSAYLADYIKRFPTS